MPVLKKRPFHIIIGTIAALTLIQSCDGESSASDTSEKMIDEPHFTFDPPEKFIDEQIHIVLSGITPASKVTIRAKIEDDLDSIWTSEGTFIANNDGVVDLSTAKSLSGSYEGVDYNGLIWSLSPVAKDEVTDFLNGIKTHPGRSIMPVIKSGPLMPIEFSAEVEGAEIAVATYHRELFPQDLKITPVKENGLRGVLFQPKSGGPYPGIIILGGSDGGIGAAGYAGYLAQHGYAAMALAYFNYADLPKGSANIPLEYFHDGIEWMKDELGQDKIAIMGISRGSEAALLVSAKYPDSIDAIIAWTPSHLVNNGLDADMNPDVPLWTYQGKPLPYALPDFPDRLALRDLGVEDAIRLAPYYLDAWDAPDADEKYGIPVEKMKAPLLLVAGTDDGLWPSSVGAERIVKRLVAHNYAYPYLNLEYEGAGHGITLPNLPMTLSEQIFHTYTKAFYITGGTPQANANASNESWRELLEFLDTHLTN